MTDLAAYHALIARKRIAVQPDGTERKHTAPNRDVPLDRLPPLKARALQGLTRGPITGAWNAAWHGADGAEFNTHTVLYLTEIGLAKFNAARTAATATQALFQFVAGMERAA